MMTAVDEDSLDTRTGLTPLCHSQWIQSIIVVLLTSYTDWCPRYDEFQRRYANSLCLARQGRTLAPEEFTSELIAITGTQNLAETGRNQHIDVWREASQCHPGIGGGPRELLEVLSGFIEICFPRTFREWFDLAQHACDLEGGIDVIQAITESVIHNMQPSIQCGYVALRIEAILRDTPTEAFAHCMTWLQRYLALTELAMPTPAEVDQFAELHKFSLTRESEAQRTDLAIMLQSHDAYSGVREQRAGRENPFAFMLRHNLTCLPSRATFHPEITANGLLVGLRAAELHRCNASEANHFQTAGTRALESLVENSEPVVPPRNRGGNVTDDNRKLVRAKIEVYKKRFNGQEPSPTVVREALRGRGVGNGKVHTILNEMRDAGEYGIPRRVRRKNAPVVT